jgi:hypothetical protein
MKPTLSTFLRASLSLALIVLSPGLAPLEAAAQSVSAAVEARVSGAPAFAPASPVGVSPIGNVSVSLSLAPALSAPSTPLVGAAAAPQAPVAAAAGLARAAAPAAVSAAVPAAAAAHPVSAAAAEERPAAEPVDAEHPAAAPADAEHAAAPVPAPAPADAERAAAATHEDGAAVLRADPAERLDPAPSAAAPSARTGWGFGRLARLFDGLRSRRSAAPEPVVDPAAASVAAAATPETPAPSGLSPAASAAPRRAAPSVPSPRSPRVRTAAAVVLGLAATAVAFHFLPFASFQSPAVVSFLHSSFKTAMIASAVVGALSAVPGRRSERGGALKTARAAVGGAASGTAKAFVAFNVAQMAFNGLSVIGLNPLLTAIAAAVLARTALARLGDPTLSRGARVKAAIPAVVAAALLAAQSVLTLSVGSAPAVVAAIWLAISSLAALAQAASYAPSASNRRAFGRLSFGLMLQALMLGGVLAVIAPSIAWWFVGAGGAGFLLTFYTALREVWSSFKARRAERAARAIASAPAAAPVAAPAPDVRPEAIDPLREGVADSVEAAAAP